MKTNFYLLATYVEEFQLIAIADYFSRIIGMEKWNFDFEDSDNVLRLYCDLEVKNSVIHFLKMNDLFKEELHYLDAEISTIPPENQMDSVLA